MASHRAALTMLTAAQPAKATLTRSTTSLRLLSRRTSTATTRPFHRPTISIISPLKQQQQQFRPLTSSHPRPQNNQQTAEDQKTRPSDRPSYELRFTCKPCGHRSSHTISKQGYHHGSVLISCPSCRNRHIISDHLKIFGDKAVTIEDILREKGQLVKKGTLGEDEDVEFWEDGTITERHADLGQEEKDRLEKYKRDKEAGLTGDLEGRAPGETFGVVKPPQKGKLEDS
ncbi:DNL zinc finger-domain-containing protein [Rhypophila decipiens]|uniref:DNL zinc finger-domain-containing protein n=1 Tax=Rhypophila decipiens TaxID=261697 RepID=A0AAN6YEE1_9PEZI|nr:DNL zinc finger-domain-containing protein [Rhypophila decipiens]